METFITEQEAKLLAERKNKTYQIHEFFPTMFVGDKDKQFDANTELFVAIFYLGNYTIKSSLFGKLTCPICGAKEVVPYHLIASPLSENNRFKGYCLSCNQKLAFTDHTLYTKIRDYIIKEYKNKDKKMSSII